MQKLQPGEQMPGQATANYVSSHMQRAFLHISREAVQKQSQLVFTHRACAAHMQVCTCHKVK